MVESRRALPTRPVVRLFASALLSVGLGIGAALTLVAPADAAPTDAATEIIGLTNGARAEVGAAPLLHSDDLQATAQAWAQHLADTATFEHNPSVGDQIPADWRTWGENIAMGTSTSPSDMHTMWMNSPGHYANLSSVNFNVMGVGYATASDGTAYGVEVFARYPDPSTVGAQEVGQAPAPAPAEETTAPAETPAPEPAPTETPSPEAPAPTPTPEPAAAPAAPPAPEPTPTASQPMPADTCETLPDACEAEAPAPSASAATGWMAATGTKVPTQAIALGGGSILAGALSIGAFAAYRRSLGGA